MKLSSRFLRYFYKKYKDIFDKKHINPFEYFIIIEAIIKYRYNANKIKQLFMINELRLSIFILIQICIIYILIKYNYSWEYYLNKTFFYNNWYFIKKPVFIPRESTSQIIEIIKKNKKIKGQNCLEIGVGSGALLNEVYNLKRFCSYYGTDFQKRILNVAKINCKRIQNLYLFKNDWCKDISNLFDIKFDLILSNPPYVKKFSKQNYKNESKLSSYGNKRNIFDYYIEIIDLYKENKNSKFYICLEIPCYFLNEIAQYLKTNVLCKYQLELYNTYEESIKIIIIVFNK